MCFKAVEKEAERLEHVPNHFKTGEICKRDIDADLCTLVFCADWFVSQEQIKSWYDGDYDDETPGFHDGYQNTRSRKHK